MGFKCREILECLEEDADFLKTVITGDKLWIYGYDLKTEAQFLQRKSRTRFQGVAEIQENVTSQLFTIRKQRSFRNPSTNGNDAR